MIKEPFDFGVYDMGGSKVMVLRFRYLINVTVGISFLIASIGRMGARLGYKFLLVSFGLIGANYTIVSHFHFGTLSV